MTRLRKLIGAAAKSFIRAVLLGIAPRWNSTGDRPYQELRDNVNDDRHDEKRQAKLGDTVRISSSRPLSKLKRWRLKEVLTRNASAV